MDQQIIGKNIFHVPRCASTQALVVQWYGDGKVMPGDIVMTDDQYQGRGQLARKWESTAGQNLMFSLVLCPSFLAARYGWYLSSMVALALHSALCQYLPSAYLAIKWPNDLYYQNRKLGGVLIENTIQARHIVTTCIGIGLNVNQVQFQAAINATSLALIAQQIFDRTVLLKLVAERLTYYYAQLVSRRYQMLHQAYTAHLYGLHEVHSFQDETGQFQGIIRGVTLQGRLIVARGQALQYYQPTAIRLVQ